MNTLHHVAIIIVPGTVDQVCAFYVEVFGFRRIPKTEATRERGGAWLEVNPATQIHLSERPEAGHPDAHFAVLVEDFDATIERLATRSASWTEQAPVFGGRRGFTRDPAGNRVEVIEGPRRTNT